MVEESLETDEIFEDEDPLPGPSHLTVRPEAEVGMGHFLSCILEEMNRRLSAGAVEQSGRCDEFRSATLPSDLRLGQRFRIDRKALRSAKVLMSFNNIVL